MSKINEDSNKEIKIRYVYKHFKTDGIRIHIMTISDLETASWGPTPEWEEEGFRLESRDSYTCFDDTQGNEMYEKDIVEIKGHPFEGAIRIDGTYVISYNERMELCCGDWLLHRMLPYIKVIGSTHLKDKLLAGGK